MTLRRQSIHRFGLPLPGTILNGSLNCSQYPHHLTSYLKQLNYKSGEWHSKS
jgi:hypothetical protein